MKTIFAYIGLLLLLATNMLSAQDKTTVRANNIDISDNLDLRAVAHIFGESSNLEDFENRLNDPKLQISNLDLNGDNQVDYLRVIESVENSTHLVIIQAVLGRDLFQDVATIEVEKDRRNRTVQVQVVGDVFLYGHNYIYEPVYYHTPVIYTHFWIPNYVVYYSPWYWNYYPRYYWTWNPYPIFRYRNNVNVFINVNNTCHYVNVRRSQRAVAMHQTRRSSGYETQYPNRSFAVRNQNISNRYELTQARNSRNDSRNLTVQSDRTTNAGNRDNNGTRNTSVNEIRNQAVSPSVRNNSVRTEQSASGSAATLNTTREMGSRSQSQSLPTRSTAVQTGQSSSTGNITRETASQTNSVRNNNSQTVTPRNIQSQSQPPRSTTSSSSSSVRSNANSNSIRSNTNTATSINRSEPRSTTRNNAAVQSSGSQISNKSSVRSSSSGNTSPVGRRN